MKKEGFLNWKELIQAKRLLKAFTHRLCAEDRKLKGELLGRLATVAYDQFHLIQTYCPSMWVSGKVVRDKSGELFLKTRDSDHESVEHYGYEDPYDILQPEWIDKSVLVKVRNNLNSVPIGPIIFAEAPTYKTSEEILESWRNHKNEDEED
jgi:hypothetical protein